MRLHSPTALALTTLTSDVTVNVFTNCVNASLYSKISSTLKPFQPPNGGMSDSATNLRSAG